MRDAQLEVRSPEPEAKIVGQFGPPAQPDNVGAVLQMDNPLVDCVNEALAQLKADGTAPRHPRPVDQHRRGHSVPAVAADVGLIRMSGVAPTTPPELLGSRTSRLLGRLRPGGVVIAIAEHDRRVRRHRLRDRHVARLAAGPGIVLQRRDLLERPCRSSSARSWKNIQLFLLAEFFILIFALVLAVMRSLPGPVFFPFRLMAVVYIDSVPRSAEHPRHLPARLRRTRPAPAGRARPTRSSGVWSRW